MPGTVEEAENRDKLASVVPALKDLMVKQKE